MSLLPHLKSWIVATDRQLCQVQKMVASLANSYARFGHQ
jgi:hypothetical protein